MEHDIPPEPAPDAKFDVTYDGRGLLCPLPVLRARKILAGMAQGQVVQILADDPVAVIDLPHFCAQHGHEMLRVAPPVFVIRKGPAT